MLDIYDELYLRVILFTRQFDGQSILEHVEVKLANLKKNAPQRLPIAVLP